ncbi:SdpI family protein [Halosaccharopolyspora lacisalsi]|uniref:hypothetical protein n=1 Tax=Halosaccharopolyspora lacisalsi TaxID=1000566 RepID=UPI0015FBEB7A|nr:hypothetical protein [Halosaccharopolyspora lacisalsi]
MISVALIAVMVALAVITWSVTPPGEIISRHGPDGRVAATGPKWLVLLPAPVISAVVAGTLYRQAARTGLLSSEGRTRHAYVWGWLGTLVIVTVGQLATVAGVFDLGTDIFVRGALVAVGTFVAVLGNRLHSAPPHAAFGVRASKNDRLRGSRGVHRGTGIALLLVGVLTVVGAVLLQSAVVAVFVAVAVVVIAAASLTRVWFAG